MASPGLVTLKLSYSCSIGDITPDQLQAVMHDVTTTDPGMGYQWTLIAPFSPSAAVVATHAATSTITPSDITPNLYQGPQFCATAPQQVPVTGKSPEWPLGVTKNMGTVPTVVAELLCFGTSLEDITRLKGNVMNSIKKNLCPADQPVWVTVMATRPTYCSATGVPTTLPN